MGYTENPHWLLGCCCSCCCCCHRRVTPHSYARAHTSSMLPTFTSLFPPLLPYSTGTRASLLLPPPPPPPPLPHLRPEAKALKEEEEEEEEEKEKEEQLKWSLVGGGRSFPPPRYVYTSAMYVCRSVGRSVCPSVCLVCVPPFPSSPPNHPCLLPLAAEDADEAAALTSSSAPPPPPLPPPPSSSSCSSFLSTSRAYSSDTLHCTPT